jgi:hypothetical protein
MMALRKAAPVEAEPMVRVADVLAQVAGVNPSVTFDEQAERTAATLRPAIVSRDWSNRPCVSPMDATRLWQAMKRDAEEEARERLARAQAAEDEWSNRLPAGTIALTRPGHPDLYAPGVDPRVLRGPLTVNEPG